MTKNELVNVISKQKEVLAELVVKNETNEELINRMRYDYLRELSNLRE